MIASRSGPPADRAGVIAAETGAIEHYTRLIEVTDGVDPVTQDMVIDILRDEQAHRRLFEGFLREVDEDDTD
jgi:bacterioferritin